MTDVPDIEYRARAEQLAEQALELNEILRSSDEVLQPELMVSHMHAIAALGQLYLGLSEGQGGRNRPARCEEQP